MLIEISIWKKVTQKSHTTYINTCFIMIHHMFMTDITNSLDKNSFYCIVKKIIYLFQGVTTQMIKLFHKYLLLARTYISINYLAYFFFFLRRVLVTIHQNLRQSDVSTSVLWLFFSFHNIVSSITFESTSHMLCHFHCLLIIDTNS